MTEAAKRWGLGGALVAAVGLVVLALAQVAGAHPGQLDESFGNEGTLDLIDELSPADKSVGFGSMAVGPDGSMFILVGNEVPCGESKCRALRVKKLDRDGHLDASFDSAPVVQAPVSEGGATGQAIALAPNGRLLVVAGVEGEVDVVRLQMDGSVDRSFGAEGIGRVPVPSFAVVTAIARRPDGRLVLAGTLLSGSGPEMGAGEIVVAQLTAAGLPDPSFGQGGVAVFEGVHRNFSTPALVGTRRGVFMGLATPLCRPRCLNDQPRVHIDRISPSGELEDTHSEVPRGVRVAGEPQAIAALRMRRNGGLLVVGRGTKGTFIEALGPRLRLDRRFGKGGVTFVPEFNASSGNNAIVDRAGRLVVGGSAFTGFTQEGTALVRLRPDGRLDRTFEGGETLIRHVSSFGGSIALGVQPDGRIVDLAAAVGLCRVECGAAYFLDRFEGGGRLR
jgi:uncharacterized delta-60 repeat protein